MEKLKPHMLKHCTGALSPTLSHWTGSSNGSLRTTGHSSDPSVTAAAAVAASGASPSHQHDPYENQEDLDIKKEEMNLPLNLFSKQIGLAGSSILDSDAARSSATLRALGFMSTLSGAYSLPAQSSGSSNPLPFSPSGLQSIYSGSGKSNIDLNT